MHDYNEELKDLKTEDEASSYLRISRVTLCRQRRKGRISFRKVGGQIRYTESDLKEYLENAKRPTFAAAA